MTCGWREWTPGYALTLTPLKLISCVTQGADDLSDAHSCGISVERPDKCLRNHVHVVRIISAYGYDVDLYTDELVTTVGLLDDLYGLRCS